MEPTLILGSRGSELALWQARHVAALLEAAQPGLHVEIRVLTTTGDRLVDKALPLVGGKGLFTQELEQALMDGSIDLAVHSLKDLPIEQTPGLTVGAVPPREDPADCLVSRSGADLGSLPAGAQVGTGSPRRRAQLLLHRADLRIEVLRGNADTRLRKALDSGDPYDAIVIALAALRRLGKEQLAAQILNYGVMLPAPGQGALAVQCREDPEMLSLLAAINDQAGEIEVNAERGFLEGLGGGCAAPVGARATLQPDGLLRLAGRVLSPDGREAVDVTAARTLAAGEELSTLFDRSAGAPAARGGGPVSRNSGVVSGSGGPAFPGGARQQALSVARDLGIELARAALARGAGRLVAHDPGATQ